MTGPATVDSPIVLHVRIDAELEEFRLDGDDLVVPSETHAAVEVRGEVVVLDRLCPQ